MCLSLVGSGAHAQSKGNGQYRHDAKAIRYADVQLLTA